MHKPVLLALFAIDEDQSQSKNFGCRASPLRKFYKRQVRRKEVGLEPEMVPWYPSYLPEESAEGKESSSDEEVVLAKTMKKKRGRKQKVPSEDQESNAVTTDEGTQVSSHLSRMEINDIVGVVEPVTSRSGMTARGISIASYSTAAMPTIEISTDHNAISSANTSMPGTAVMHPVETHSLQRVPHAIMVAPEIQHYWTGKANRWQMSSLGDTSKRSPRRVER